MRALQVIAHAQHVAGEAGRGIAARVGHFLVHPAPRILQLGRCVERLAPELLELGFERFQPVVLGQLGRARSGFLAQRLGFVVQVFFVVHAINLVSAFAVNTTMGTTRA